MLHKSLMHALIALLVLSGTHALTSPTGDGSLIVMPFVPLGPGYGLGGVTCDVSVRETPYAGGASYLGSFSVDSLAVGDYEVLVRSGDDTARYDVSIRPGTLTHLVAAFPSVDARVTYIERDSVFAWVEGRYRKPSDSLLDDLPFEVRAVPTLQAPPVYPESAQRARLEGVVHVELSLDSAGNVVAARVAEGIPEFDDAAVSCVREWRFRPAKLYGQNVPSRIRWPMRFQLRR